ncbi:hypothetical protein D9M72_598230 [compost metagenome]
MLAAVDGSITLEAVDHLRQTVEDLDARLLQFGAHEHRERAADDARENREDQVQRADVLVVGRQEPALKEAQRLMRMVCVAMIGVIMALIVMNGCSSHGSSSPSDYCAAFAATSTVLAASMDAMSALFASPRLVAAAASQVSYFSCETTRIAIGI